MAGGALCQRHLKKKKKKDPDKSHSAGMSKQESKMIKDT